MRRHTSFFKEHQAMPNRIAASDFLNELGHAAVRYFAPGNIDEFNASVDEAYEQDADAHLVLLDDYRILDVTRTIELNK